jgi:GGDEF domain-containing protein
MPIKSAALQRIAGELSSGNIAFRYKGDTILVDLPNDFDVLEISIWKDDEDSIQLLNGYFHTHGSVEAWEYGPPPEKAIRIMLERIFSGELLCVEIRQPGQEPVRTIVESIEQISAGAEFTVYNKNA